VIITRRQIRHLIRKEIRVNRLNEVMELMCDVFPEGSRLHRICYSGLWIYAKVPHSELFTLEFLKGTGTIKLGPLSIPTLPTALRFLGFSEGAVVATATGAGLVAAFAFVAGAFYALPKIIGETIEILDTADGLLMNLRARRENSGMEGPLEYNDMSAERTGWIPSFGDVTWNRDMLVDFIASQLDTTEGRALYNKLTSEEEWSLPAVMGSNFKKYEGPIISKSFSDRILKRKGEMIGEANEKMRESILERLDSLLSRGVENVSEEDGENIINLAESLGWEG